MKHLMRTLPQPHPDEWWEVETRWDKKTTYFTNQKDAFTYACSRIEHLIYHRTAGPKENNTKLTGDKLRIEWIRKPGSRSILVCRLGTKDQWWFGGRFTTIVRYNGPTPQKKWIRWDEIPIRESLKTL